VIGFKDNSHRVLQEPELLPTIFQARDAHQSDASFVDKLQSLLDQLALTSPAPSYIEPARAFAVPTLRERSACVVAAMPHEFRADLYDDVDDVISAAKVRPAPPRPAPIQSDLI
jgi:hypothetical protein